MRKQTARVLLLLCAVIGFGSLLIDESTFNRILITVGSPLLSRFAPAHTKYTSDNGKCPLGFEGSIEDSPHGRGGGKKGGNLKASSSSTSIIYVADANESTIWTGDPSNPSAEAMLITDDRITYVGTKPEAQRLAGPTATIKHLSQITATTTGNNNNFLMPCFIDPHIHLIPAGLLLSRLDFRRIASKHDFISTIATAAAQLQNTENNKQQPKDQWILGGGYDESHWGGASSSMLSSSRNKHGSSSNTPTADWVDGYTPNNPLFIMRADAHTGLANSRAMQIAGITADTKDPEGGVIERDSETGQPTGILRDAAMQLVIKVIPPASVEERRKALVAASMHALKKGVCAVHDMGRIAYQEGEEAAWEDLEEVLMPLANEGKLPLRVYSFVALETWRRLQERVKYTGTSHPSGRLYWGGVKGFADGSLGSRTALMHQPYIDINDNDDSGSDSYSTSNDSDSNRVTRAMELEELKALMQKADSAGLQVAIHAIGDRAVDDVLDIYTDIMLGKNNGSASESSSLRPSSFKHRIEHVQHISSPLVSHRLSTLNLAATLNPLHLPLDSALLETRIGKERAARGAYDFKTLLSHSSSSSSQKQTTTEQTENNKNNRGSSSSSVAFASDWPVVELDPIQTILAATQRDKSIGSTSSTTSTTEAVEVEESLIAQTRAAAEVGIIEDIGILKQGMKADFIILDKNPIQYFNINKKDFKKEDGMERKKDVLPPRVVQTYMDGYCVYGCGRVDSDANIDSVKDEL